MPLRILALFVVFSNLLCGYVWAQENVKQTLPSGDFTELRQMGQDEVIEIVTPYTLLLADGRIARLSGIEIPEPWDVTARDILKDLLINQRTTLYQTKKKDWGRTNRMGHHLMHLQRADNGAWAQGVLLSLGLARVRTTLRNPEMAAQMLVLEQAARKEKLGLWSDENFALLNKENAADRIGDFAIIEDTIKSVTLKKNRIFMNFGGNWRDDFTVSIPPAHKRNFTKAGLDPMNWGNKTIRVRGHLESVNGPSLEIDHPEAIEVIDPQTLTD